MRTIEGNLLDMFDNGVFNTIIHGCNTKHDMSGGIALQIAKRYPEAVKIDFFTPRPRVGEYSYAFDGPEEGVIINAYTQENPGADATLEGIYKAFLNLKKEGMLEGRTIGIPMIGSGIGGLVWDDVERVLDSLNLGDNITVVKYVS